MNGESLAAKLSKAKEIDESITMATLNDSMGYSENSSTFHALINAYSQPHRFYHNTQHIKAVLGHLEKVESQAIRPQEVALALWFHDAVYKPFSSTNEKDSAQWAADFMAEQQADTQSIDRVKALIMATLHSAIPTELDQQLLVDIDLSILGSSPKVYDNFEVNVRKEYQWVPAVLYRRSRRKILQNFLDREKIYQSQYFNTRLESQARENIARVLTVL